MIPTILPMKVTTMPTTLFVTIPPSRNRASPSHMPLPTPPQATASSSSNLFDDSTLQKAALQKFGQTRLLELRNLHATLTSSYAAVLQQMQSALALDDASASAIINIAARLHLLEEDSLQTIPSTSSSMSDASSCECRAIDASKISRLHQAIDLVASFNRASVPLTYASSSRFGATPVPSTVSGRVLVCTGAKCRRRGALATIEEMEALCGPLAIEVVACKCLGKCASGPAITTKLSGEGVGGKAQCFAKVKASSAGHVLNFAAQQAVMPELD